MQNLFAAIERNPKVIPTPKFTSGGPSNAKKKIELSHPLTRRTPPRSEKNGFEPEFEPPFWDILADIIKSSLLAGRNNPAIEEEVDVI